MDKTQCTQCNTNYYLKDSITTTCYANTVVGYGINPTSTYYINACTKLNCKECFANNQICEVCNTGYRFKAGSVGGDCFSETSTAGYGKDPASSTLLQPCQVANCQVCVSDYTQCSQCNTGYRFIFGTTSPCISEATGQAGYGPDLTSSLYFKPCASTCQSCPYDYTVCVACNTGYRLKSTDSPPKICYDENTASGYGWVSTNSSLMQPCGINCATCLQNVGKCNTCNAGFYLKPDSPDQSICYSQPAYPLYGLSGDGLTLLPCPAQCVSGGCSTLYTRCTACNSGFNLINDSPTASSCQVTQSGYRYDSGSFSFQACPSNCSFPLTKV